MEVRQNNKTVLTKKMNYIDLAEFKNELQQKLEIIGLTPHVLYNIHITNNWGRKSKVDTDPQSFVLYRAYSAWNKYFASARRRVGAGHLQFVPVFCIWYTIEIWKLENESCQSHMQSCRTVTDDRLLFHALGIVI